MIKNNSIINNICYKEPEYMNKLNKQEISLKKGKIIFIPLVNYCGLQLNSRNHNTVGNINRLYNSVKNINIINKLIINFSKISDFIIDFHETSNYANKSDKILGSTITPVETETSLQVANIVVNHNKKIKGSLREYADINKFNYILVEITGMNNVQSINIRVQQCINIINSVLENYNMIKIYIKI